MPPEMHTVLLQWSATEKALWFVEIVFIVSIFLGLLGGFRLGSPRLSVSACATVLSLGWVWRLIYMFTIAAGGFVFFIPDDPSRWNMAAGWAKDPYFVTWDAVWLGGTFYLHGAAMRVVGDPLMASKLVSAAVCSLPIVGTFLFTQGVFRSRLLSCVSAAAVAPWWIHILLGTGTLTELPVVGLVLGGAGLLLLGLEENRGSTRWALLSGAALAFFVANSFHYAAWFHITAILAALGVYSFARPGNLNPRAWIAFSFVSGAYALFWAIGCWFKFGDPFYFLKGQIKLFDVYHTERTKLGLLAEYPRALSYSLWPIAPLAIFGMCWSFVTRTEWRGRSRAAVATMGLALAILIGLALKGAANATPYRTLAVLATAAIPFAFAPVILAEKRRETVVGRRIVVYALFAFFAALWWRDNHEKTLSRQRLEEPLDSDSIALGSWLRQELIRPQQLKSEDWSRPIRLWLPRPETLHGMISVIYLAGDPAKFEAWYKKPDPELGSLQPGQVLVADQRLTDRRLTTVIEVGRYTVYRFLP